MKFLWSNLLIFGFLCVAKYLEKISCANKSENVLADIDLRNFIQKGLLLNRPVLPRCRVPDDWLLKNKRPLLHGREVLQAVLATWQACAKELPC